MRGLRYILIALFLICCRGLSAQEFDLYDFRYYKRFETVEELLAPDKDTLQVATRQLNHHFTTHALDYNLSAVRFARRGILPHRRKSLLNGIEIPFISNSTIRALQIETIRSTNNIELHIDTLRESYTSVGFSFSSRNMPYSLQLSTAQRLEKAWSLATNVDARIGHDLHIDGLFGKSFEVDAVASKLFDNKHLLSFGLFAKPSMRSSRLASTAEAFRLTGNNLYNPAWGYQAGKVRSARIRREFLPTVFVGYEGAIGDRTKLNLTTVATAGIERYSVLDWFDAQTAAPDNYRYMPSYFYDEDDIFSVVESAWLANNPRYTQVDFDRLTATNQLNGDEAVYAISDRVERIVKLSLRGEATTSLDKGQISYGIEATATNNRNYKQMRDLLGAKFIIDLDYFLRDDDTYGNSLQNNLASPNRRVTEGDRFGYDYAIREYRLSLFGIYNYSTSRLDLNIAAKVGYCDISRRGFYHKELFSENSFGVSRHLKFSPYAGRIAVGYFITDHHFIRGIISSEATPCEAEDMFLQSQYNNRTIDSPTMRSAHSAEMQYIFHRPKLDLSATLFFSTELNDISVRHIYDDLSGEYADIVTSNLDYMRYGLEIEAEYRFANHFRATAALTVGRYKYSDCPHITIYSDSSNILLAEHIESKIRGFSLGNMPQIAATAGVSYYNLGWNVNLNLNYAGLRYIEPSVVMRTERVLSMATSTEQRNELIRQERLRDAFTIDLSLSKSIYLNRISKRIYRTKAAPRFEDKYPRSRLAFRVGVRNLLGSTNIVYNAYESSRLQRYKLAGDYIYNRQASRYMYAYPRTFYASSAFIF